MRSSEVPVRLDKLGRKRSSLNTSRKGGNVERVVVKFLEAHGYHVYLPEKLSRTAFDRVATRTYCTTHRAPAPCNVHTVAETYRKFIASGDNCEFVCDERWIQVKSNQWSMSPGRGDLTKVIRSIKPPPHASREFFRHIDHPHEPFDPILHLAARQVLPDGSWYAIALLPEWGTDELPGCI